MSDRLSPQDVVTVAQSLTLFQSCITDYELRNYPILTPAQLDEIGNALSVISASAGRLYAYAVVLEFDDLATDLGQLQTAGAQLKKFLKTVQKIDTVLDVISTAAAIAAAIMSHDVEGIGSNIGHLVEISGIS
jgi:hypothetical protein